MFYNRFRTFILSLVLLTGAAHSAENMVIKTLTLNASQDRIWSALTVEAELGTWWNPGMRLQPHVGGEFYEPWGNDQLATGTVLEVDSGNRIKFTWKERSWEKGPDTICEFSLTESKGVTTLTVRHSGWETFADPERRAQMIQGFNRGWDFYLSKLQTYIEE